MKTNLLQHPATRRTALALLAAATLGLGGCAGVGVGYETVAVSPRYYYEDPYWNSPYYGTYGTYGTYYAPGYYGGTYYSGGYRRPAVNVRTAAVNRPARVAPTRPALQPAPIARTPVIPNKRAMTDAVRR